MAARCLIGWPIVSDVNATYTPTFSGGTWSATLPLTNLQDRRLAKVARSTDAAVASTRFAIDLQTARRVGLIAIPKHTLSQAAKVRILGQTSATLFDYEAGDDVVAKGGTFTRATTATYVDSAGVVRTAASGVIRDGHFVAGRRTTLLEGLRANLQIRSQEFDNAGAWNQANVTVTANAVTAPDGTLTADKLLAATTAGTQMNTSGLAIVGTSAAWSVFVKRGSGDVAANRFVLRNSSTATNLCVGSLNYATGVLTVTTGAGYVEAFADGWYRVTLYATTSITSGNACVGYAAFDSSGATAGDFCYAWGGQVEVGGFSSSYIPTTTVAVTRNADLLQFPFAAVPQPMSIYAKVVDAGYALAPNGTAWVIGNVAGATTMIVEQNGHGFYHDGVAQGASLLALVNARNALLESLTTVDANADVIIRRSTNGAAAVTGTTGATATLFPSAFSGATITIGGGGAWANGFVAVAAIRALGGVQTFAYAQAAVYDSGWLDVWPQVFPVGSLPSDEPRMVTGKYSTEDAAGFNIGFVHIPATAQVARLWSVQIDDTGNAEGYIDLGRLVIASTYQPTINMSQGARLSLSSATTRTETDGGAAVFNDKPRRREQAFTIDSISEDEALVNFFDMQRRVGTSGQFYFAHNAADTYHLHRRAFLCTMRELSAIEYPFGTSANVPFAVIEEL